MTDSSFCALVGLLLTKLNHFLNDSIEKKNVFWLFVVTLKIGDTAPLSVERFRNPSNKPSISHL